MSNRSFFFFFPGVCRDIQASSILLDDKFEVRLGSLSEVCAQEGEPHQSVITRFLRKWVPLQHSHFSVHPDECLQNPRRCPWGTRSKMALSSHICFKMARCSCIRDINFFFFTFERKVNCLTRCRWFYNPHFALLTSWDPIVLISFWVLEGSRGWY